MVKQIDFYNINYDDEAVWDLISEGRTKGVFQLEKNLGQSWSKKIKPRNIEELSDVISLIRPGCLRAFTNGKNMTQHYADRKSGQEQVVYLHPALESILKNTQGVIIYQESSILIAQKIAGFTLNQADALRKAIGHKLADVMAKVKLEFLEGCKKTGIVEEKVAEEIFGWIEESQRYSFNKSHGVAYATMAYWSAYCKVHHPVEFYTSWLFHAKDKQKPQEEVRELVADMKNSDITILPPDITRLFNGDQGKFSMSGQEINFGIQNIKRVGKAQGQKLVNIMTELCLNLNSKIEDISWIHYLTHLSNKISKTTFANCISAGAFRHLKMDRKLMLKEFDVWSTLTEKEKKYARDKVYGITLLERLEGLSTAPKSEGGPANYKRVDIVNDLINSLKNPFSSTKDTDSWLIETETNLLGVSLTQSRVGSRNSYINADTCNDFLSGKPGKTTLLVEISTVKQHIISKGLSAGKSMAFVGVEDDTGQLDVVVFAEPYEKYQNLLYEQNTVVLYGYRSKQDGFVVDKVLQI